MNTPEPADHHDPSADETSPQSQSQSQSQSQPQPQEPVKADEAETPTESEAPTEYEAQTESEAQTETESAAAGSRSAAVFVRRRVGPSLTFWVMLCLAVPAVATLVIAPLLGVSGLTEVFTVTLAAVFGIGAPLAGLCAVIDAIIHRKRR